MKDLPFGFQPQWHPATCVKCHGKTFRRITRDVGICAACEGKP